jgi:RecJ-like exonuclease
MKIVECTKCRGFGVIEIRKECPVCKGTGSKERGIRCANCIGWGYIGLFYPPCEDCNGKGFRDWIDEIRRPV